MCSRSHIPTQKQEKDGTTRVLRRQSGHPEHSQSYGALSLCLLKLKVTLHTLSNPPLVPLLLVSEVGLFQRNRIFVAWTAKAANLTLAKVW